LKPRQWGDQRGAIVQTFNAVDLADLSRRTASDGRYAPWLDWVQENVTVSERNVLRGGHGYWDLWRLYYCVYGEIYFAVVNCKDGDGQFGRWQAWNLHGPQWGIVLVPPGFGMACLTLSNISIFAYKWSGYYERHEQFRFRHDDPRFGIEWPGDPKKFVLSERDRGEQR
ncbi:MAG: dTDP-4-dehydrorhamnose 3,5-epimerase family protein, partial [Patescibacteria group bacterium]